MKVNGTLNLIKSKPNSFIENYATVMLEDNIYTSENLNVSHFRNGDKIFEARTNEE